MAKKTQHPNFIEYMHFIANHPTYSGMPDLYKDDGEIQWEAPSNRMSGKFMYSHKKRLEWWRTKALEIGIDPSSNQWISKTAKKIHPLQEKPCSVCGRIMDLRYAYPSSLLIARIRNLNYLDKDFELSPTEHIEELVIRLVDLNGEKVFEDLYSVFRTGHIWPVEIYPDLGSWLTWINHVYIPAEPITLSPGAMSNAPDRLDGFHTYNRCCRHQQDTGRSLENLRSYTTDRRVFEYWNQGDWIAADRMMGQVRSKLRNELCLNGHPGPCSADHIGPLSLGFNHRPEFQMLCSSCNSAKNNRMFYSDVLHLRRTENAGIQVISWHSKSLWDLRKGDVTNEETANRLSKLLRDNRHTVLYILKKIADGGYFTFLSTYLDLNYADYNVEFGNLQVVNHITKYDSEIRTPRLTKYALEQKVRRCRVAFSFLLEYFKIPNRNGFVVTSPEIEKKLETALAFLSQSSEMEKNLDKEFRFALSLSRYEEITTQFENLVPKLLFYEKEPPNFSSAKKEINQIMEIVAGILSNLWIDDRYIRQ